MTDAGHHGRTSMIGPLRHVNDIKVSREDVRIPITRYTSHEFLKDEQERLWPRVWQLACRADDVPNPGDFFEYKIGKQSFLIVRDEDRSIRAMHNVCPHRGNVVKNGTGNTGRSIVCGFHMWSYNLDGSLKRITDRDTFCELDDAEIRLRPVAVDTWAGWVFIHTDPDSAEPLLDYLSPLPELLDKYHLEQLVPVGLNLTTTISANWKVAVEAFLEVYHIHAIHPQLLPNGDDMNVWFEHWERHSRMTRPFGVPSPRLGEVDPDEMLEALFGPRGAKGGEPAEAETAPAAESGISPPRTTDADDRRSQAASGGSGDYFRTVVHDVGDPWALVEPYRNDSDEIVFPEGVTMRDILREFYINASKIKGADFSELEPDQFVDNFHYLLFPNVIINVNVGSILFMRLVPDGDDPGKCYWDIQTFDWVLDPEKAKAARAPHKVVGEKEESLGLLLDQDVYQMPRVQQGLQSGGIDFMTLSNQENRLVHFNEVLDWSMGAG